MPRVLRWLGWSVAISLTPFIGLGVLRFLDLRAWPGLEPLLGSGQLLLTSVAILSGGVRELADMRGEKRSGWKNFLLWASFLFAIVLAMAYGSLANEVIGNRPFSAADQALNTVFSGVVFLFSVGIAAAAVAISKPEEASRVG